MDKLLFLVMSLIMLGVAVSQYEDEYYPHGSAAEGGDGYGDDSYYDYKEYASDSGSVTASLSCVTFLGVACIMLQ